MAPEVAEVLFRRPVVGDGAAIWRLARDSGELDLNSPYYYLVFASRFADSSVVACAGERVVGFVTGFLDPAQRETLFVWQVGVDESVRGQGIASRMLDALLARDSCARVTHVDTTVTPSNEPSKAMFRSLARRWHCPVEEHVEFAAADFPVEVRHEPEVRFRIGPLAGRAGR